MILSLWLAPERPNDWPKRWAPSRFCLRLEASRDVVAEHIRHLILQLTEIIRNGTEAGEWNVRSPTKAAEAILNATIVFHHPAFVSRPGPQPTDASARDTLKLLIAGLKSGAI